MEFIQVSYVVIIGLAFAWSLASMVAVAGTRGSLRQMTARTALVHDGATRTLKRVALVVIFVFLFAAVAWGVTNSWPILWSPRAFW